MRARPLPVTVAAVIQALFSVLNLLFPLLPTEGIPAVVVYGSVALGVVGLGASAGLWLLRRWSIWLTIVVSVLNILAAVPGITEAPNAAWQVAATLGVLGFALVIVLVVLPTSRRAFAASY